MSSENLSVVPAYIEERRLSTKPVWVRRNNQSDVAPSVACILDNLSMTSYAPEARFHPLTMKNWQRELIDAQPDLLFVESAWRGHEGTWWNSVQRCGPELRGIVEWCKSRSIPTVFWNKEDPVHFSTFLNSASLFDLVFTTDVDCVPRYRAALKHDNVFFLPFAAQPLYHNPVEEFQRIRGCSFAGAYYEKYAERNRDFAELFSVLRDAGVFDIYDRNYGIGHEDQSFPAEFRQHVVGGLQPSDIGVAYKAYKYSLNLNSVKQSQSMFARRVFELLASNTGVISNYSRGLSLLFGDLTLATDGSQQLRERLREIELASNGLDRLRQMGVRKIFREHTYRHRLREILYRTGIVGDTSDEESVLLISFVEGLEQAKCVVESALSQTHKRIELLLVGHGLESGAFDTAWISLAIDAQEAESVLRSASFQYIGFLDHRSWYGPEYVKDLLEVFSWAKVARVGHAERYTWTGSQMVREDSGTSWTIQPHVPFTRALMAADSESFLAQHHLDPNLKVHVLAVSTLEFCADGSSAPPEELEHVKTPAMDLGLPLVSVQEYALSLDPQKEATIDSPLSTLSAASLLGDEGAGGKVSFEANAVGEVQIASSLSDGEHEYVYNNQLLRPFMLPENQGDEVYLGSTPGLEVMLAVIYFDGNNQRIGHSMLFSGRNNQITWPENVEKVRVGIRVRGSGSTTLKIYSKTRRSAAGHRPISRNRSLLVTNIYPSYESLYRNAFIASRTRRYRAENYTPDVFCLQDSALEISYREYEGTEVLTGNREILGRIASEGEYEQILIHFLSEGIWQSFKDVQVPGGVTVWIHGFEAQPWWRRRVAFKDFESRMAAIEASQLRMNFWRRVLDSPPAGWHFVFVSEWLAQTFFEDVGVSLRQDQYTVVHNLVDTDLFTYERKPTEQRFQVLSIRPYASKIYANDLSVAAVLELQRSSPQFDAFEFHFYGDGVLFDETMQPIREIPNVHIHQGFLSQMQIASLHKDFGVFLVPSRMDTQGVSRGEAMASGLVPITNAVAAIPEFVDADSGIAVPPEDPGALANALQQLADDPDHFDTLSYGAAQRVRRELSFDRTIGKELELLRSPQRASRHL